MDATLQYFCDLVVVLESNPNVKKTLTGVLKQTCWTAAGTAAGGLLGGPVGAVVGAGVGALFGYWATDDYASLLSELQKMDDEHKCKLVGQVQQLVGSSAVGALTAFVGSEQNATQLAKLIGEFASQMKNGA